MMTAKALILDHVLLKNAILEDEPDDARRWIEAGIHLIVRYDGETALHLAVRSCGREIEEYVTRVFRALVKEKQLLEVPDLYGDRPLHLATKLGYLGCVKTLVESGAQTNATDREGRTPLMLTAIFKRTKVGLYFLGAGIKD